MALRRAGRPDGADHRVLAILNRDYTSVTPHSATPQADGESNTIRVGSYQELVNALIYLIGRGNRGGSHPL